MEIMANVLNFPDEAIDLIYLDPPFFTNRQYEVIWGDSYEVRSFEDRWAGGIENYIAWMEPRLRQMRRILKSTGSLYLHCDWHANAHLRILMDKIFGESNFRNDIVWCYSGGGIPKKDFPRKHDTIFRYAKGADCTFNTEYRRYSEGIVPTHSTGEVIDLKRGTPITDWWTDIKIVTPYSARRDEKLGYPTQKPEALLERIINVSSNTGDVVLDPFCGCGTAIAVAQKLGRKWIGIDVSPTACNLMQRRMAKLGLSSVPVIGLPMSVNELRALQPFDFQNWVIGKLMGRSSNTKTGDMGIDGYLFDGTPVQVKQSNNIGRNVIDNFETAMRRIGKTKGIIVAFSFGKGAREEVARARNQDALEIELRTVQDILDTEVS